MNARHPFPESSPPGSPRTEPDLSLAHSALSPPMPGVELPRHLHRQRDFGIGYGNSSGYGSDLHYVDGHVDPIFRFFSAFPAGAAHARAPACVGRTATPAPPPPPPALRAT